MSHITQKATPILLFLVIMGAIFRFYDLNWGAPYYFHPDERNIANSVTQLSLPTQLNPKFFAYGSLPIYTIYFFGMLLQLFQSNFSPTLSFPEAIVTSRIFSAIFSALLIPLIYLVGKHVNNKDTGIIAAAIATFTVGLIQFAHFGTFEMWLTFWTTILFFCCIRLYQSGKTKWAITIGIVFGILCAIKVSSAALAPLIILTLLLHPKHALKDGIKRQVKNLFIIAFFAIGIYLLTNPFVVIDFQSFIGSMRYESGVATGSLPVFYTGEFVNVIPILYPFISIYPFLLNPLITALFIPAFFYLLLQIYQTRNKTYLLLAACFLLLFISQVFLYVQWTRYYVPTIPFIILTIALFIDTLLKITYKKIIIVGTYILFVITILYATAFTIATYYETDTRIQARNFATANIKPSQEILSEVYDLGVIPFNESFSLITLYDFYALDGPNSNTQPIPTNASYVILPSQRLLKVRLQNPNAYPRGHAFYQELVDGRLGYKKIYETPCSIWCKIIYFNNPMGAFEGTASVFDRPIVTIFQK